MNIDNPTVILITGPAASGKTSTATKIAENQNWVLISEDDFWDEIKKNRPPNELRTDKEEDIVRPLVVKKIMDELSSGKNVVLEFLVYDIPPKSIIYYKKELLKNNVNVVIRVLRPNIDTILKRVSVRGRADDAGVKIEQLRKDAKHQIECLRSKFIDPEWVIDNSNISIEEVYNKYFLPIIEQ